MAYPVALQNMQALADVRIHRRRMGPIGQLRRIAVRNNGNDAGRALGYRAVDGCNTPVRDRASHNCAMRLAGDVELGGVSRSAGDLLPPVHAAEGFSDDSGSHARVPAVSTARTIARCISSILKSL